MTVHVRLAAQSERPKIERLLNPYLKELSQYREVPVGATDASSYPYLGHYWSEPDRYPFTIWHDDDLAGFALVRRIAHGEGRVMQLAEFYVAAPHRRRGVGCAAAATLWKRFPGQWELETQRRNVGATRFWTACIARHASRPAKVERFRAADGPRVRFRFVVD